MVPFERFDVIEHGAGSIGIICYMDRPAGQLPDQPAIHRPEQNLPPACALPRPLDMVKNPFDLGSGKIGIGDQACGLPDRFGMPIRLELVDDPGGETFTPLLAITSIITAY